MNRMRTKTISCIGMILLGSSMLFPTPTNLIPVDGIKAVVRTPSAATTLVLQSELQRPYLDGTPNTLENVVKRALLTDEAKKYHMIGTSEETEKQLRMVAQSNNVDLSQLFSVYGYTLEEGKEVFAEMTGINNLINFKITSNLFVSEKEVRAYYDANPEYEEAAYYVQYVLIPFDRLRPREEQKKELDTLIRKKDSSRVIDWQDPFWINDVDISPQKNFIKNLKVTEFSQPVETAHGFELFKLLQKKDHTMRSFESRYRDIVDLLRRPKYGQMLESYQKQLIDDASIIYF